MLTEKIIEQTILSLTEIVHKTNEINKRLVLAIVGISLVWGITLCIIMGFYFLGEGYPDTSQTLQDPSGVRIEQNVNKGGDD